MVCTTQWVTRDGVPMLANPFNWRVRWPRPARVLLFSLGLGLKSMWPQREAGKLVIAHVRLETRYIDIGKSISIIDRNFLHSGRRPPGAKRPSAGCPECICNRPRPWRRPCVSDWGCGAVILLSRGEFGREKNKICYQRGCVWTFCYMPNL